MPPFLYQGKSEPRCPGALHRLLRGPALRHFLQSLVHDNPDPAVIREVEVTITSHARHDVRYRDGLPRMLAHEVENQPG